MLDAVGREQKEAVAEEMVRRRRKGVSHSWYPMKSQQCFFLRFLH